MHNHNIFLSKYISIFYLCFTLSNITIAKNSESTLLHALMTPNEATVSAVMQAQSWKDQQRTVLVSQTALDGVTTWEKQLVLKAGSHLSGMVSDAQGNLYLAGHFQNSLEFNERLLEGDPGRNFFLLSLNAQGDFRFMTTWQSNAIDHLSGLQISALGDIWIAGYLSQVQQKSASTTTFWMHFDDLGEVDRVVTLKSGESHKEGNSPPVAPVREDWVHMQDGQMLESLLSVRGMRILYLGDQPTYVDEDPNPDPDPPADPDTPPPPPPT